MNGIIILLNRLLYGAVAPSADDSTTSGTSVTKGRLHHQDRDVEYCLDELNTKGRIYTRWNKTRVDCPVTVADEKEYEEYAFVSAIKQWNEMRLRHYKKGLCHTGFLNSFRALENGFVEDMSLFKQILGIVLNVPSRSPMTDSTMRVLLLELLQVLQLSFVLLQGTSRCVRLRSQSTGIIHSSIQ